MSPSERSFMLLLFTETSKNTIWHSPALVVSNKWAFSPRSNWPGHVWHHEFWVPWLLEKEKFEIWSSRIRWLLSWPGQRCQEAYSNNNKIFFLTDLEARVQGQYVCHHVDSWLYPNLLPSLCVRSPWLGHHLNVACHISCLLCVSVCFFLKDTNYLRVVAHPNDLNSYRLQLYTVGNQGFVPRDGGEDLKFHCQRTQHSRSRVSVLSSQGLDDRRPWPPPLSKTKARLFSAGQSSLGGQLS